MRFAFCFLTFLFVGIATNARASCGSATCPIDVDTGASVPRGFIRLDYAYESIDQSQPRAGRRKASVGEIRGHHDEESTFNSIQRFSLEAGLRDGWTLLLSLPFVHREHQHTHHHHGTDVREAWNIRGMGDLTVLNRLVMGRSGDGRASVSLLLGGSLPTGRDTAKNEAGSEAEVGITPGSGAHSLIAGLAWLRESAALTATGRYAPLPVFVSSTMQWYEEGRERYRLGRVWQLNAGAVYPALPKVGLSGQVNLRVNGRDDRGRTSEEVQKTGGTFVFLTPGIEFRMSPALRTYVHVQLPVYQRVNVIQLTSDVNLLMGASYRFSAL